MFDALSFATSESLHVLVDEGRDPSPQCPARTRARSRRCSQPRDDGSLAAGGSSFGTRRPGDRQDLGDSKLNPCCGSKRTVLMTWQANIAGPQSDSELCRCAICLRAECQQARLSAAGSALPKNPGRPELRLTVPSSAIPSLDVTRSPSNSPTAVAPPTPDTVVSPTITAAGSPIARASGEA
jgi:hypothetical protein